MNLLWEKWGLLLQNMHIIKCFMNRPFDLEKPSPWLPRQPKCLTSLRLLVQSRCKLNFGRQALMLSIMRWRSIKHRNASLGFSSRYDPSLELVAPSPRFIPSFIIPSLALSLWASPTFKQPNHEPLYNHLRHHVQARSPRFPPPLPGNRERPRPAVHRLR